MIGNIKLLKKQIEIDWLNNFTELRPISLNKIYKVVGNIIIGLELINIPGNEEYRPHFVIYPLWRNNIKECLQTSIFMVEYFDKKNNQIDVPYEKHNKYKNEIFEIVKEKSPLELNGNIFEYSLYRAFDNYSNSKRNFQTDNSYFQATVQESKLFIAIFSENNDEIQVIMKKILNTNWDEQHFKHFGRTPKEWIDYLIVNINNPSALLKKIEINKSDKKIAKLVVSNFLNGVIL